MPFGMWNWAGPKNRALDGGGRIPVRRDTLWVYFGTPRLARGDIVDIVNIIRKAAGRGYWITVPHGGYTDTDIC